MVKEIVIILINWNRKDLTLNCIKSINKYYKDKYPIVVVDNNSTDDSVKYLKKSKLKFQLILNKKNFGWAGGHNVGIKYALLKGFKKLFIFANDATLTKGSIEKLDNELSKDNVIGIVGPKTYYPKKKWGKNIIADAGGLITKNRFFGINRGQGEVDNGIYDELVNPDYITGAAMLIRREVFDKIGLFDEKLFIYYEDVDFCYRAKKSGFVLKFVPEAIIHHEFAATTKIGSPVHTYYTTRNHLLFVERYAPLRVRLKEFIRLPKTIYQILKDNNTVKKYSLLGIRDYLLRRFGGRSYW